MFYTNGNYTVYLDTNNGTKVRYSPEDEFKPILPESMDVNISTVCNNNCPYCYLNASKFGKHGNLNLRFFLDIPGWMEIAINYAEHPDLETFLSRKIGIVNMTVNQRSITPELLIKLNLWKNLGYIKALGVSATNNKWLEELYQIFGDNLVVHIINKIGTEEPIDEKYKILILGYKHLGRGENYTSLKENIDITKLNHKVIAFDNLAIEQLDMKSKVSPEVWKVLYQGDEGQFSMYIDTVNMQYAKSSCEEKFIPFHKTTSLKEMFNGLKK